MLYLSINLTEYSFLLFDFLLKYGFVFFLM